MYRPNRIRVIANLLLLVIPLTAGAQCYSLDSCVTMALKHNKQIEAAEWTVKKFEHNRKALYANYFPNIDIHAVGLYSTVSSTATMDIASPLAWAMADKVQNLLPGLIQESTKEQLANRWTQKLSRLNPDISVKVKGVVYGNLQLQQPLYMGGKITAGYRMGKVGEQMARLGQSLAREEVILQVYDAYQLMVKAKELHLVALKYDSLLLKLEHDVEKAIEQGMASRNEKLKVQVKKNEAELKLMEAENGILLARMNLCQLIGLPLITEIDVATEDGIVPEECCIDRTATPYERTEAELLDRQVEMARQQVKLEQAARLPEVGIGLQVGVLDGLELLDQRLFRHKPVATAMISVKMPIYHAGEVRHKVAAAKADLERQQVEREEYLEKMELELQQKANLLRETKLELRLRERHLEQCEENLRISRKSYDVGLESLSDLLTAQVLWQEAYANQAEARYKLKSRWIAWRKAAGRLKP